MIGETNIAGSANPKGKVEKVNLTIKTNQSSHEDLVGMSFTLKYENIAIDYTWDVMTVEVPDGVEYTILFNEVQGYSTPASVTYTAVSGNARTINAVYKTEVVEVTVSAYDGADMTGQVVTINGTQYTWDGTAITQKIPFGTIYAVSVNDKEEYATPQSQSFEAKLINRNVVMEYSEIPVTDLSKVDIYGNPVMQNTANCYVIKEAGKYQFPIAYGAAIKNGAVNAEAYTKNSGSYSHDFVNYKGNVITSPYVETDTATQAASVQISIADMDNAVTNLEIVNGDGCRYVTFEVPEVPAVGANAVISVKDSSGVIMWNWHLWLWEDDLAVEEIANAVNIKYKILPYNLGSKWDEDTKEHIKNWFYQFGRPTPLICPSAYNSTTNHASYGALNFAVYDAAANLYTGIQNPTIFYKYSSSNNWFKSYWDKNQNLWDAACTINGYSENNVVKTVYDPCPPGFKMPNGNTFTGFGSGSTVNAVGSFANGLKFKRYSDDTMGVFFPASGLRGHTTGSLYNVGSYGYVWSAASYTYDFAYHLLFGNGSVDPHGSNARIYGLSVRPVKDEDLALPTHKLTINVSGSGYEVKVYSVTKSTDETTGEVTETLGDVLAIQTTASATHELIWGTEYKIVAGDVESYITPESQSYTADVEYRSVNLEYVYHAGTLNPTNGVYIQDTDGYFHTETEWDGSYTPNGIAVITSNCRFVMALEDTYNSTLRWGGEGKTVSGIMTTTDRSTAATDYSGESNTTTIISALNGYNDNYGVTGAPAAEYCRAYTFPDGSVGYIGAVGEWKAVLDNKAAITSALSKCGGATMRDFYWTSTQYDSYFNWYMDWLNGYLRDDAKHSGNYVRAFAAI